MSSAWTRNSTATRSERRRGDAARGARDLLALDFVGPMIARRRTHRSTACARSSRRRSASSTSGRRRTGRHRGGEARRDALARDPRAEAGRDRVPEGRRGDLVAARRRRLFERRLPHWVVHTWTARRTANEASASTGCATPTTREVRAPRGVRPQALSDAQTARVWYSPAIARFKIERGATALRDGSAVQDVRFGSEEWLLWRSSPTAARRSCSSRRSCGR